MEANVATALIIFFVAGLACAFIGWACVHVGARSDQ